MGDSIRWTPDTPAERDLVVAELDAIVSSYHFRGSKRYPAFLKYVVHKTLDGHLGDLKERTLGVEVFDRQPDYDTNADPVVRFSASEVRKRIAQYYHESTNEPSVEISLPLGSYVPEFSRTSHITLNSTLAPVLHDHQEARSGMGSLLGVRRNGVRWMTAALSILLLAGGLVARHISSASDVTQSLWGALLKAQGPVIIVVGTTHPELGPISEPAKTTLLAHEKGPYHDLSLSSAVALSRVAGVLRMYGKAYTVKEDSETSLVDLRARPLVLVGAMNNSWTMRLVEPLRFRFIDGPPVGRIEDTRNPQNLLWNLNFEQPYNTVASDYAVIARYRDTTTGGPVMIIGGLGTYGTEAASELVASPEYLTQVLKKLPAGWENKNLELVLKTPVVGGEAGPPSLVSYYLW